MKLIIAGYGYVGKAVSNCLGSKHDVIIVDPKFTQDQIKDHHDADGIIICVPTPTTENNICDANFVANVLDQVPVFMPVMIKSTVTPAIVDGFTEIYSEHSIVYSPEFLRAKTASQDFASQKYFILGGEDPENFWQELFRTVLTHCNLYLMCTEKEACMIKYASNSFLALKTSYFNQLFEVCEKSNLNFNTVRQLLSQDSRIGSDHTMVPGPDGEFGWGGHCFPKDTSAFIQWTNSIGSPVTILEEAVNYNRQIRKNT